MSILDPRLWLAFLVWSLVLGAGAYLRGHSAGTTAAKIETQKQIDAWRVNAEAAAELYETAKSQKQIEYRTITKTVEAAKHATPDIPDCRTGDDWMQLYRQTAAIANSGKPAPAMPPSPRSTDRADAR